MSLQPMHTIDDLIDRIWAFFDRARQGLRPIDIQRVAWYIHLWDAHDAEIHHTKTQIDWAAHDTIATAIGPIMPYIYETIGADDTSCTLDMSNLQLTSEQEQYRIDNIAFEIDVELSDEYRNDNSSWYTILDKIIENTIADDTNRIQNVSTGVHWRASRLFDGTETAIDVTSDDFLWLIHHFTDNHVETMPKSWDDKHSPEELAYRLSQWALDGKVSPRAPEPLINEAWEPFYNFANAEDRLIIVLSRALSFCTDLDNRATLWAWIRSEYPTAIVHDIHRLATHPLTTFVRHTQSICESKRAARIRKVELSLPYAIAQNYNKAERQSQLLSINMTFPDLA